MSESKYDQLMKYLEGEIESYTPFDKNDLEKYAQAFKQNNIIQDTLSITNAANQNAIGGSYPADLSYFPDGIVYIQMPLIDSDVIVFATWDKKTNELISFGENYSDKNGDVSSKIYDGNGDLKKSESYTKEEVDNYQSELKKELDANTASEGKFQTLISKNTKYWIKRGVCWLAGKGSCGGFCMVFFETGPLGMGACNLACNYAWSHGICKRIKK
ncbi:hypothetical protein NIE88_09685 [Sporolactobacillus shoreicorticis]|uniref:Uncharacterized protein n=1 Tax=Sporolactobacillus shoreicorticis TaxID=1923877 RepID=A0ABW5S8P5_9BACL|nr:hypothetical protein [Sporolactobacillus shoreicorticis]MCO7126046.1 hypothetical protein [Sporolactobacillus shoreicorticis]